MSVASRLISGIFLGAIMGAMLGPAWGALALLAYFGWLFRSESREIDATAKVAMPPTCKDVHALYQRVQAGTTLDQVANFAGNAGEVFMAKRDNEDELSVRRWRDDKEWSFYAVLRNGIVESTALAPPDASVSISFENKGEKPE